MTDRLLVLYKTPLFPFNYQLCIPLYCISSKKKKSQKTNKKPPKQKEKKANEAAKLLPNICDVSIFFYYSENAYYYYYYYHHNFPLFPSYRWYLLVTQDMENYWFQERGFSPSSTLLSHLRRLQAQRTLGEDPPVRGEQQYDSNCSETRHVAALISRTQTWKRVLAVENERW